MLWYRVHHHRWNSTCWWPRTKTRIQIHPIAHHTGRLIRHWFGRTSRNQTKHKRTHGLPQRRTCSLAWTNRTTDPTNHCCRRVRCVKSSKHYGQIHTWHPTILWKYRQYLLPIHRQSSRRTHRNSTNNERTLPGNRHQTSRHPTRLHREQNEDWRHSKRR